MAKVIKTLPRADHKIEFTEEQFKQLHPECAKINRIYEVVHPTNSRLILSYVTTDGVWTTISYPKALMEVHLGRVLNYPDETVDHINNDPMDNRIENLQILSCSENAKKQHRDGLAFKPPKDVPISHIDTNGSKNGMSKISEEDVLRYRREYTSGRSKKSIVDECGLSIRTVENFLFGRTYERST
jgi:hypothetical protein